MAEFETTFADLGLKAPILEALNDLGYENHLRSRLSVSHTCFLVVTCWAWPRLVAVKPQHSRCRC